MGIREAVRHHDKATIWLTCLCGNDGFQLGSIANRRCDRLDREGRGGGFEWVQENVTIWRRCQIEQESSPIDARCNLFEQLQPLASNRRLRKDETGDVAARPREARDEAAADWVSNDHENDGDGACLLQQRRRGAAETMRSGCSATSSLANRCLASASSGVAQRMSNRILRPSTHPSFWSSSWNAAYQARASESLSA